VANLIGASPVRLVSGSGLPAGVTLQAIDGETMLTSTTMSRSYYSRNGFTVATTPAFTVGKGNWWDGLSWDDARFFHLGVFFGVFPTQMASFLALKCPVVHQYTGDTNVLADLRGNGIWSIDAATFGAPESPFDAQSCVGFLIDEQDMMKGGSNTGGISNVAAASQVGRFWYGNQTWSTLVHGDSIGPTTTRFGTATVTMLQWFQLGEFIDGNSVLRQFDSYTADVYYFAGSADAGGTAANAGQIFAIPMGTASGDATAAQMKRGSNYGNMVDVWRSYANGTNNGIGSDATGTSGATARFPVGTILETNTGSVGGGGAISANEINWAAWSNMVHGGRLIDYFDDAGLGPADIPAVNATQIAATNTLISQLAPVINAPFALGYVVAVSPHGYIFPVYEQNWLNGGIECCAHWYQGGNVSNQGLSLVNGFYIFATTRNAESVTNTSATFTVASGATATVVGESRSIPIVAGQFTDTFANAWTVHIYQIS
jgi:hypothetical protein